MMVMQGLPAALTEEEFRELERLIKSEPLERNNDKLSRCADLLIRAQVDASARPDDRATIRLKMALNLLLEYQPPKVFERIMKERREAVEKLFPAQQQRRR